MSKKAHNFILIGIGNHLEPKWDKHVSKRIDECLCFSGGKRHYELVKSFLPINHKWIKIEGKMNTVIEQYEEVDEPIIVFTSGDPFFYGFGNTLKRLCPEAVLEVYPYFSSIQRLCHKTQINYGSVKTVTLHGRPWQSLDEALIQNEALIGVLTDSLHSPKQIAQRLIAYNYVHYEMIVGEELDGELEKVNVLSLEEAAEYDAQKLNCVVLKRTKPLNIKKCVPDDQYQTLEGRPGMITKLPIRLISLQALELENRKEFWDIGSCTGAIAIEAKLNFPQLNCVAFEKREECDQIITSNTKKHQAPGISILIGDFFEQDLSALNRPEAIFIGGHGNRLKDLIEQVDRYLEVGGVVVMNAVLEKSYVVFHEEFGKRNYTLNPSLQIGVNQQNTIRVLVAKKK